MIFSTYYNKFLYHRSNFLYRKYKRWIFFSDMWISYLNVTHNVFWEQFYKKNITNKIGGYKIITNNLLCAKFEVSQIKLLYKKDVTDHTESYHRSLQVFSIKIIAELNVV